MPDPRIFGSVIQGCDTDGSDLDILVDPTPETTLFDIGAIRHELMQLLGVPVDVVTPSALPDEFRASVFAKAVALSTSFWRYFERDFVDRGGVASAFKICKPSDAETRETGRVVACSVWVPTFVGMTVFKVGGTQALPSWQQSGAFGLGLKSPTAPPSPAHPASAAPRPAQSPASASRR